MVAHKTDYEEEVDDIGVFTIEKDFEKAEKNEKKKGKKVKKVDEEQDPWDVVEQEDTSVPWKDLTTAKKVLRVVVIVAKVILILACLYLFICSLDCLQYAFQMLSGRSAGDLFQNSVLINNPVSGVMIGVFVTVLVQSSSTSTSIVVTLVGANIVTVKQAIPLIMGANIGTTVTNTIVALTQSPDRNVFRRAFAGATVHDAFNWLNVIVLLVIEVITGYLYHLTGAIARNVHFNENTENPQFLKVITKPLTSLIVQIDKGVITAVAQGKDRQRFPLSKYWKKTKTEERFVEVATDEFEKEKEDLMEYLFNYNFKISHNNATSKTGINYTHVLPDKSVRAHHLFAGVGLPGYLSEVGAGLILLFASLIAMTFCLIMLVKILTSLFKGPMTKILKKGLNAEFPGKFAYFTGYVAMILGMVITILFQSSSVFTSAINPLIGMGLVTIERAYPITLGSNIGTTVTAILAAFTAEPEYVQNTVQISMCHLFFNITGIVIFYPIPFMRIPIPIAKALGNITAKYRWFAIFYLIVMFGLFPLAIFGLSLTPNAIALIVVGVPFLAILVVVIILNILQRKRPQWLPKRLRDWKFLPRFLRSFGFYDQYVTLVMRKVGGLCKCCRKKKEEKDHDVINDESSSSSSSAGVDNLAYEPVKDKVVQNSKL